jgi:protein phosphatase-4 regulatory subunit 3
MKGLLAELVEEHWEQLQGVDYCEVFANMRIRHDQNQDRLAPGKERDSDGSAAAVAAHKAAHEAELLARQRAAAAAEQRRRRGEREVDADEESYFDKEDSDDEEPAKAADGGGGNGGGRVVLENTSPLPGLLGPLVDYGEDDEEEGDTLPLRAAGTPKRSPVGERPGSPPLEKRFKAGGGGGAGAWPAGRGRGSPPGRAS